MNEANLINVVLWSVQVFLALFFLAAGAPKLIGRGMERWTGFSDLPRAEVVFIGVAEVLGAAGLVLPMATQILPWLTPLAAIGLAIIVLMASGFHQRAAERLPALETALWASIAAVIAIGRWNLVLANGVAPLILIAATIILVPSVVINLVAIFTKPVTSSGTPQRHADSVTLPAPSSTPTASAG